MTSRPSELDPQPQRSPGSEASEVPSSPTSPPKADESWSAEWPYRDVDPRTGRLRPISAEEVRARFEEYKRRLAEIDAEDDTPEEVYDESMRSFEAKDVAMASRLRANSFIPPGGFGDSDFMPRISPLDESEADPDGRGVLESIVAAHGRTTNMKRTLARSPVALDALMTWYNLRDAVVPFPGERATTLFAHAISSGTDCLVCSTFFRRMLIDSGEDPDSLRLDDWEQTVVAYGRQLAVDPHGVSNDLFGRLTARLEPDQIVTLTAFGGLMVATNLFNNALRVDLDEYLHGYRKEQK
jgi:alkylhydroperoxidase family enzyme